MITDFYYIKDLLVLAIFGFTIASCNPLRKNINGFSGELLDCINEYRTFNHLNKLNLNTFLNQEAGERAKFMLKVKQKDVELDNDDATTLERIKSKGYMNVMMYSEIDGFAIDDDIKTVFENLLKNNKFANAIDEEFEDIGMGVDISSTGRIYYVIIFGKQFKDNILE